MVKIRIDIDELATAMEDHDNEWLLDIVTGQILISEWLREPGIREDTLRQLGIPVPPARGAGPESEEAPAAEDPDEDDWDDEEDWDDSVLDDPRFIGIDSIPSHQGFRWMERFAAAQDDERVRARLFDSLDRPKPFRRFKDALMEFPEVREAWFRYHDARLREEAIDFVRSLGPDVELYTAGPDGEVTIPIPPLDNPDDE